MNAPEDVAGGGGAAAGRRLGVSAQVPAPSRRRRRLAAARTLYASAEYGGALDMLNGLLSQNPPAATGRRSSSIARSASWRRQFAEARRIIEA
jgi:hypothetical protein